MIRTNQYRKGSVRTSRDRGRIAVKKDHFLAPVPTVRREGGEAFNTSVAKRRANSSAGIVSIEHAELIVKDTSQWSLTVSRFTPDPREDVFDGDVWRLRRKRLRWIGVDVRLDTSQNNSDYLDARCCQ